MPQFLSYETLRISEEAHDALVEVLSLLENGELKHVKMTAADDGYLNLNDEVKFTGHFNMSYVTYRFRCGTAACIKGTAELLHRGGEWEGLFNDRDNFPLYNLFYPNVEVDYETITTAQAAIALRSYLEEGYPDWGRALNDA